MGISGKVINGRLVIKYHGVEYPLIKSNAKVVEAYMISNDPIYLNALASEKNIDKFEGDGRAA